MEFSQVTKLFSLFSMLRPKTDTIFVPNIKSYVSNSNTVFSINAESYGAFWPHIIKIITRWCTLTDFNFCSPLSEQRRQPIFFI